MSKPFFYIFLCIISWAFIPVASKNALIYINNFAFLFFSNLISAIVMFFYIFLAKGTKVFRDFELVDYLYLAFLGFLGSFAYYVLLYRAFSLASAQEIFVINYTWPILVVVLSIFILKCEISFFKVISILMSFVGVWVIATKGNPLHLSFTNIRGDLFALVGAFCFALFSVLGKKSKLDPEISVFFYFLFATFFSILTLPFFEIRRLTFGCLFWVFINGVFVNGVSYIFWFKALKGGETSLISNIVYLTPFVSLVFIYIFLKEKIHTYSLIALALIMGGILLQSTLKRSTC